MLVIAAGILLAMFILMVLRSWVVILSLIVLCIVAFSAHSEPTISAEQEAKRCASAINPKAAGAKGAAVACTVLFSLDLISKGKPPNEATDYAGHIVLTEIRKQVGIPPQPYVPHTTWIEQQNAEDKKSTKTNPKTNDQFINLGGGRVQSPDGRIFSPPSGSAFDSLVRTSPQGPMTLCSGNMALKPPDCKQYKDEFIQHQMRTPEYQYLGSIGQCRYRMLMMGHKNPVSVCG